MTAGMAGFLFGAMEPRDQQATTGGTTASDVDGGVHGGRKGTRYPWERGAT